MPVKLLHKHPTMVEVIGCLTEEEGHYLQNTLLRGLPDGEALIIDLRGLQQIPDTLTFSSLANQQRQIIYVIHRDSEIAFALDMLSTLTNKKFQYVHTLADVKSLLN